MRARVEKVDVLGWNKSLARLASANQWDFLFLQGMLSNTLAFKKNLEGPALYLRVTLRLCVCVWRFPEEAPKFLEKLIVISAWAFLEVLSQSSRNSCLFSTGLPDPSTALSLKWSRGIFVSCFPVSKGLQNSWRDCSAPASNLLGSLLSAFLFHCSSTKKFLAGSLT